MLLPFTVRMELGLVTRVHQGGLGLGKNLLSSKTVTCISGSPPRPSPSLSSGEGRQCCRVCSGISSWGSGCLSFVAGGPGR